PEKIDRAAPRRSQEEEPNPDEEEAAEQLEPSISNRTRADISEELEQKPADADEHRKEEARCHGNTHATIVSLILQARLTACGSAGVPLQPRFGRRAVPANGLCGDQ